MSERILNQVPVFDTIEVKAGDSLAIRVTLTAKTIPPVAVDLSAWDFTSTWVNSNGLRLDFEVDDLHSDTGIIDLLMTPEQTREMGASGKWDLQGVLGVFPNETVKTFGTGKTTYKTDITL